MSSIRQELANIVRKWQEEANRDATDGFKYEILLDDLLFQADMRFRDYVQFDEDGPFPYRLKKWLDNSKDVRQQKWMFRLLQFLVFVDDKQMQSLYREAYRGKVAPWVSEPKLKRAELLAPDYQRRLLKLLSEYYLCSITESFDVSFFKQVNSLVGLPKMEIIGERLSTARDRVAEWASNKKKKGLIIFEDMVGTGNQASKVLCAMSKSFSPNWRSLFVPLIALPSGFQRLNNLKIAGLDVSPVLIAPERVCIQSQAQPGEPDDFKYLRSLVVSTKNKVTENLHPRDDAPKDPFGYEGSGALIVTAHNTPNNTLPLIHHRAPDWAPLFRRVHHLKDE